MKQFFLATLLLGSYGLYAQEAPKQATIKTKTTIVSPDGEEDAAPPPPPPPGEGGGGGGQRFEFRFGGDGETLSTTFYKNGMYKVVNKSEMGNISIIRDNSNKKTITLSEMMGRKTAVVATDQEQEELRKQMDSMMQANPQFGAMRGGGGGGTATYEVIEQEGSKKVAGYDCKKALLIGSRGNGRKDTTTIWYAPSLKFEGLYSTGGLGGGPFGNMMRNTGFGGFENLKGFPLWYERAMNRGRKMIVEITKIDIEKEIKDAEFEIPKDFEIQSAKDVQQRFGNGRGMIRIGG